MGVSLTRSRLLLTTRGLGKSRVIYSAGIERFGMGGDMATKRKGDGLLLVYSDVAPENDEEYNRWYNEEHIPERLSIPGVLGRGAVRGGAGRAEVPGGV